MHANESTELPEAGAIQMLIDELLPSETPAPPKPRNGVNGSHGGPAKRTVLGAHTLKAFLQGVNWVNAASYQSPFERAAAPVGAAAAPRRVIGALPLREFLRGVNWSNAAAPAALDVYTPEVPDHARLVIDTFMNEIEWD